MTSTAPSSNPGTAVPKGYWFFRGLVRLGFAAFSAKIRLLHADLIPAGASAVFGVSHAASFHEALVLVASLERPVRCLVPEQMLQTRLRRLFAAGLGMIPYNPQDEGWGPALDVCFEVLKEGGAIAVFAEPGGAKAKPDQPRGPAPLNIALEAEARHSGHLELAILPLHLFLPVARRRELLVYVDNPIYPREYMGPQGSPSPAAVKALATRVEDACHENAFRLQPTSLKQFLADLEETLRADLEEDWSSRPNWKQKVEGFQLSRFAADWVDQTNDLDPGKLVTLREALDEYREGRRRWSLRELDIAAGGVLLRSRAGRALIWLESAIGLPLAFYGLINHLPVWLLFFWFGLLKKGSQGVSKVEWLLRVLVILGCYSVQVLLCLYWLNRPTATLYALSLPLAGAYLLRYDGLLRHRTRRAIVAFRNPAKSAKLRQRRKGLLDELNKDLDLYAEKLGVAH